jgi:hypothetical protein
LPPGTPSIDELERQIDAVSTDSVVRRNTRSFALSGIARAEFPPDSNRIKPFVAQSRSLSAALAWQRKDTALARRLLDTIVSGRMINMLGDLTPDVSLAEARLRLALRDIVESRRVLDETLRGAPYYAPMSEYEGMSNMILIANLIHAMSLRASLADSNSVTARQWFSAIEVLRAGADPELRQRFRARQIESKR